MSAGLQTFLRDPQSGRVYINPLKRHVRPFWLVTDPVTVTVAAGAVSPPTLMTVDNQGHFEAVELLAVSDGPFLVEIFDPATQKFWTQRPVHSATLFGDAGRAFVLPESYFFNVEDSPRALRFTFTNLLPIANTIRVALHGRRLYQRESPPDVQEAFRTYYRRKERTSTYFMTTDSIAAIPALSTAQLSFPMRNTDEADFEIFKVMAVSDFPFEFQIRETSTNRTLSNGLVHVNSGFGTAMFPKIFPESYLLARNFELALEARNIAAQQLPNNIFITLAGRRIYYAQ
jgi:hypothetical protein